MAISRASRKMKASYLILLRFAGISGRNGYCGSEAIFFHAAIQSASAQTERFRCMADVAGMARQSFFDKQQFYFFQAHVFYFYGGGPVTLQSQIADLNLLSSADEHRSFNGMVQFADVSRPQMFQQPLHGCGLKSGY